MKFTPRTALTRVLTGPLAGPSQQCGPCGDPPLTFDLVRAPSPPPRRALSCKTTPALRAAVVSHSRVRSGSGVMEGVRRWPGWI